MFELKPEEAAKRFGRKPTAQAETVVAPPPPPEIPVAALDVTPEARTVVTEWDSPVILAMQEGWPVREGTEGLPVALTATEVSALADQLVAALTEYETLESDKKASADRFKSLMESCTAVTDRLRGAIELKKETRPVPYRWLYGVHGIHDGEYVLEAVPMHRTRVRTDTGQVLAVERISDGDRQMEMTLEMAEEEGTVEQLEEQLAERGLRLLAPTDDDIADGHAGQHAVVRDGLEPVWIAEPDRTAAMRLALSWEQPAA